MKASAARAPTNEAGSYGGPRRVPLFMLRGVWDELERRGVSGYRLEQESGVSRPRPGDFLSTIAADDMHRLFEAGVELAADPWLGLSVGRALGVASFHLIGLLALASPTLRQALELVTRAAPHLMIRPLVLSESSDETVRLGFFADASATRIGARVEAELTAVLLHDFALNFLDGRHGTPTVQFAFARPERAEPYCRFFAGALQFDGDGTFISFPAGSLLRRRSGTDAALVQQLFTLAPDQFGAANASDDWSVRVRRAIRSHRAPRLIDGGVLAAQLGLSLRSLSRRLAREGTSLSALTDEALYERARALLARPEATAAEVAATLGYAELSSFFRAFRRWSGGLTPSAVRNAPSRPSKSR